MAVETLGSVLDASRYLKKDATGQLVSAVERNRYISDPFQLQALQLCRRLGDPDHKAIYLGICRRYQPAFIEAVMRFVADAPAKSPPRLFMWALQQERARWLAAGKNPCRPDPPSKPRPRRTAPAGEQASLF